MQLAYEAWHLVGQAHSIETWVDGELVGGLYGVSLGRMFYGESMFSRANDASKIAFVHVVAFLKQRGVTWIDCQMETDHLASLGARLVPRQAFLEHVKTSVSATQSCLASGHLGSTRGIAPLAARFVISSTPCLCMLKPSVRHEPNQGTPLCDVAVLCHGTLPL
jgi:leucyl/phenylalanyl-tRNA---protein transferase